jgi:hypothetical protein
MGRPPDGVRLFVLLLFGLIFSVSGFLSPSLARFHSGADAYPGGNPRWPPLIRSPFREGRQTKPSDSKSQINTMKTDKNSQTATTSGTLPQPEQTVSDSNHYKKYKVFFLLSQRSYGSTMVEATSLHYARQGAKEIQLSDVDNWEVFEDKMSVDSIELVSEGKAND